MFTLFLLVINLATIVGSLTNMGEKSSQPKPDDDHDDSPDIPCA